MTDPTVPEPSRPEPAPPGLGEAPPAYELSHLTAADPPKVGDFWLDARLLATPSGVAYTAHEEGSPPVLVILLSQGAADDPAARDRLAGQVNRMHIDTVVARGGLDQDSGSLAGKYRSEDDDPANVDGRPQAPWVALAFDGSAAAAAEAQRLLAEIDLSRLSPQGQPAGPDYRLHWTDRDSPGLTHVWPLPWPGRRERGGRLTILSAFLLMLVLAAVAILIAILIFSQSPPTPPTPPIPNSDTASNSGGGQSDESSPNSASPEPSGSGSSGPPPSESASDSPPPSENTGSPSQTPSETSSGSPSPSPGSSGNASPQPSSAGGGSRPPQPPI
ncbi:MAG: hypothetical protein LBI84_02200 [Propionibacteriaceae bacterium]|jgi:hypothetical protein|nr:hypothetical protein [Propionibacteriaceae bacterium]